MIEIVIPPPDIDNVHERFSKIPPALVNIVNYMTRNYTERNDTVTKDFDRLFEKLNPGAYVRYNPDRVVWEDEAAYTMFTLKWS